MKSDIHPQYNPVVFVDGEHEIITRSTMTSKETREIDGVEHYVVPVEISAYSHPFYTGKQKLMDTEGRVDRFLKRYNMSRDEANMAASDETGDDAESTDEA
ncbi:type B 50S ribosomal protein L31 [Lujinxingia vulgaris]|uniref:50S ribosomal protein L31 n=1 Tax=Lujinxingia vulgaris TaxID=2600176 RepID=A0A5C6XHP0_9DELT|nr:type B 50S ribosomal protein L31 [Lujinxingia vulgaris]TXD37025.1 type B 50S ribosomal protein L31 [Lujinxingia vulgaris]